MQPHPAKASGSGPLTMRSQRTDNYMAPRRWGNDGEAGGAFLAPPRRSPPFLRKGWPPSRVGRFAEVGDNAFLSRAGGMISAVLLRTLAQFSPLRVAACDGVERGNEAVR